MASRGIIAARQLQAAEAQAHLLALMNAKLDLLLKANNIEFDEAAFFSEAPLEETAPEDTEQSEDNPPENTEGETALTDGVKNPEEFMAKLEEVAVTGKKK